MYLYETHCHTSPVSSCGRAPVEDTVRFYQRMGYDGVFLTNHFLDGNINPDVWKLSFREQIDYYFRDYEEAAELGDRIGIRILPGENAWETAIKSSEEPFPTAICVSFKPCFLANAEISFPDV